MVGQLRNEEEVEEEAPPHRFPSRTVNCSVTFAMHKTVAEFSSGSRVAEWALERSQTNDEGNNTMSVWVGWRYFEHKTNEQSGCCCLNKSCVSLARTPHRRSTVEGRTWHVFVFPFVSVMGSGSNVENVGGYKFHPHRGGKGIGIPTVLLVPLCDEKELLARFVWFVRIGQDACRRLVCLVWFVWGWCFFLCFVKSVQCCGVLCSAFCGLCFGASVLSRGVCCVFVLCNIQCSVVVCWYVCVCLLVFPPSGCVCLLSEASTSVKLVYTGP